MDLSLVQKQADGAEGDIRAERTPELLQLGVFAVLVVLECLAIASGIRTVFTLIGRRSLLWASRVLGQHVVTKFILPLAGIGADLAHERLGLMSKLVAVQLVYPVTAVGTLVTLVPSGQNQNILSMKRVLCSPERNNKIFSNFSSNLRLVV